MSGPKTSRYTLTPEQRRVLAEQRRIERLKIQEELKLQSYNKELLDLSGRFSGDIEKAHELQKRTGNNDGLLTKTEELINTINRIQNDISSLQDTSLEALQRAGKKVDEAMSQIKKQVLIIEQTAAKNEEKLLVNIQENIDKGFATSFADLNSLSAGNNDELSQSIRFMFISLRHNSALSSTLLTEISASLIKLAEINNTDFLQNFNSLTAIPLQKKCERYMTEYEQYHSEYEKVRSVYETLCTLRGFQPENTEYSIKSITYLKSEISRLETDIAADDEQLYISTCIDEVMCDMGYSVLGSREVIKRNGKHFKNELYTFDEGTAVNVTYASDGKITMELGGVDNTDRVPDNNESKQLCDDMETFCDSFKEIEKKLVSKGVIVNNRISILPPGAEYAQIINISDYDIKAPVEKFEVQKEKRKQQALKTMRKE